VFSVVAAVVLVLVSVYPAAAWNSSGSDGSYGASTFGGTSNDAGYGVAVDSSGNVYTTGYFAGTVNFGAGNVTSAGSNDVFVTKLNASGVHQWTTTFGGTSADYGRSVAVDSSGNVYTTGYFQGTVNFGAGNVTSAGSADVFVTKLNASGVHQWTTTLGGTSADVGNGVAVDSSGNVYTTGYFGGTVNFGAGNVTSAGSTDVFVTKLNASGQLIVAVAPGGGGGGGWNSSGSDGSYGANAFGGTSADWGHGVAVDSSGNVYTTGYFAGTVNFGAGNVTSAGGTDVFVTKLNASGTHQWTTTFGSAASDVGYDVAVDSSGNVYTTGIFNGTVNFGAGNVTSAGSNDVFVTKLNTSGTHQWTTTFGSTSADYGYGVAVDSSGNVYTTGRFQGTVNFGAETSPPPAAPMCLLRN